MTLKKCKNKIHLAGGGKKSIIYANINTYIYEIDDIFFELAISILKDIIPK